MLSSARERPVSQRVRVALTTSDQMLSSLQNFVLVVLTARATGAVDFGAFTAVYAVAILLIGIFRAGIGEPILLGYSVTDEQSRERIAPVGMTLDVVVGILAGAVACGVGAIVPGPLHAPIVAMGLCVPGLVLLDLQRFVAVTWKRPITLVLLDVAWVLAWIAAVAVVRPSTSSGEILCWGLTATGVAVVALAFTPSRFAPPLHAVRTWWSDMRRNAGSLVGEFVALNSSTQVTTVLATGFLGYAATGGLRAAQNLLSPVSAMANAMRIAIVPEVMRAGGSRSPRGSRILLGSTALAAGAAAAASALFLSLPEHAGRALLGATWSTAHPLLLASGLRSVLLALSLRATMSMRADLKLPAIAWTRTVSAVVLAVVVAAFAALTTVTATAWAIVGFSVFQLGLLEYANRRGEPAQPVSAETVRAYATSLDAMSIRPARLQQPYDAR